VRDNLKQGQRMVVRRRLCADASPAITKKQDVARQHP